MAAIIEVLLVEDSRAQARAIREMLERNGFRVTHAEDGRQALRILETALPDIVLTDIVMPELDGYGLCKAIKADERMRRVPVVLLTQLSHPRNVILGLQAGADHFVTKPFREEFLTARIRYVLANRDMRSPEDSQSEMEVLLDGQLHSLTPQRLQMLDLLVSAFETAVEKNNELGEANRKLAAVEKQLRDSNFQLEHLVGQRTESLRLESRERERAFQELEASQARYATLFHEAPVGVILWDAETLTPVEFNQVAHETLGWSREEFSRLRVFDIEASMDEELIRGVAERAASGETLTFETIHRTRTGEPLNIVVTIKTVELGGRRLFQAVHQDFTLRRKAEAELSRTLGQLRTAMGGVVRTLAYTVESRDPYTAGHQQRVADLARAIAQRMELPAETVDAIRMAGQVHDVGKLSIPAELLAKPTRLSAAEFELIKGHAETGYEILKQVEFPWAVADIVRQHHERLDGKGYPQGLSGDQILLEARVIGVADVVEAMASHRPYRAALGLDAALEEILARRGTAYDDRVVDACLDLFRNRDYKFRLSPDPGGRQ